MKRMFSLVILVALAAPAVAHADESSSIAARRLFTSGRQHFDLGEYAEGVSTFRLDKYEVTVGRFRRFVNAGMGTQQNPPAAGAGANPYTPTSGWDSAWNASLTANTAALEAALQCDATYQTWTASAGLDNKPINCVTWYEAVAFCAWDQGFLPTEAEWSYAAYGGAEQRLYPWSMPPTSQTIDCTYANINPGTGPLTSSCHNGLILAGSNTPKGDGKWGQSDLGGNVSEWNFDWFSGSFINPCNDCADFDPASSYKVVLGGNYADGEYAAATSFRDIRSDPTTRSSGIGFRCARAK